jgi:hypothetical protein
MTFPEASWVLMVLTKDQCTQWGTTVIYFRKEIICTRHKTFYNGCTVKKKRGAASTMISKWIILTLFEGQILQQQVPNVERSSFLGCLHVL